jgi:hypothetical protein
MNSGPGVASKLCGLGLTSKYLPAPPGIAKPLRPPSLSYAQAQWKAAIAACEQASDDITKYCKNDVKQLNLSYMQYLSERLHHTVQERDKWQSETAKAFLREQS